MQVENSVVLVTGANGDIGQYYIEALKKANPSKIYAAARRLDSLSEIVATAPDKIVGVELDITDLDSVAAAVEQCSDVNLLINNAGVGLLQRFISEGDLSKARTEMEVNYLGTLSMCRAFAGVLKQNGGGAIINMLSILGKANFPLNASYSASKAAALSMTQGIRAELRGQGTLVVGVMPATVDTKGSEHFPPPKVSPEVVVKDALQAVVDGTEDVYPGEQAKAMVKQLKEDPKVVEEQMAETLD